MLNNDLMGPAGLAIGHKTIDEIGSKLLPVSPQNYEVWLTYLTNSSPDLRVALDALLSSGRSISNIDMEELYERFFSTTHLSTQVMETGSRIAHEIADALDALKKAGATTERYGATLNIAAESLVSQTMDGDALKRLINVLASATTEMSKQNSNLSHKLAQSSSEMDKLRTSLRQARAEALTDALTGVANRKLFDETLRLRKEEADADKSELSLILCDIDHFKSFNDTWGHQTGDQVIRFVASALTKFALPDHLVARYGGEEFAVVMPRTPLKQAGRIADQIRTAIEVKRLVRRSTNETIGAVTVSFGGAIYTPGETVSQIIARADECLYFSKRNGRNRVTLETALPPVTVNNAA
ncbi:MAG: diguanylate cyclase [Alphaproteobacteria bacterium]|nr:diguanylate cyclase [Alphaproteobacteria bacterium]